MTKRFRLVSVGMEEKNAFVLRQLIDVHTKYLHLDEWEYVGNVDAQQVIETMGSQLDADIKLVDTDSELGKRVWYFLHALDDENTLIELTNIPQKVSYKLLTKPLTENIKVLVGFLHEHAGYAAICADRNF